MEQLNAKFDDILSTKMQIVMESVSLKSVPFVETKKMIKKDVDIVDYTAKQTLSKIAAEQDRKYKSSKAYKNAQYYTSM
jgi:fructose-specific phosphotransferase system component IIB